MFGLPIVVFGSALFFLSGTAQLWVAVLGTLQILYILLMGLYAYRPSLLPAGKLALLTAILDPLILSVWLPLMNEYGGLVVGFYLFTILGFGFRTGTRLMRICQIASIVDFSLVLFVVPFWQQHPVIWLSFLITLVVVPSYAAVLVRKLHEARAHAEHESKAKSDLLARVSHELRTPLSGIMAATQLLSVETKDTRVAKRADTILGLSRDLLREINDLLDQSKYEARALDLDSVPLSLAEQVERVRLTLEPNAIKKDIRFIVDLDTALSDWVLGDPHYLSRVLINLAGNGVKFTDSGEVRIEIGLLAEEPGKYKVRFSVRDTGVGIAPEYHEKIFEPFFQVSGGATRRFGGTGLGMTIAREIVRLMGGELKIESELGKGSLFYFDLSMVRVEPLSVRPEEKSAVETVRGKRVFVVDDHETNLMLVKELLEQDEHEVSVAKSGREAIEMLAKQEFDILFLDFNLGDMDGAKLLQLYRFGRLNTAPAYFLTADATALTAEKLRNTGAAGVLNKPVTLAELRQTIADACGGTASIPKPSNQNVTSARPILKAVPAQPIDMQVIDHLRSISDRPEFLRELLRHAKEDIQANSMELVQSLAAGDFTVIRDAAHALKGVCASIGAMRLMAIANTLMRAPRNELQRSAARMKSDVSEASRVTAEAIDTILLDLEHHGDLNRARSSPITS